MRRSLRPLEDRQGGRGSAQEQRARQFVERKQKAEESRADDGRPHDGELDVPETLKGGGTEIGGRLQETVIETSRQYQNQQEGEWQGPYQVPEEHGPQSQAQLEVRAQKQKQRGSHRQPGHEHGKEREQQHAAASPHPGDGAANRSGDHHAAQTDERTEPDASPERRCPARVGQHLQVPAQRKRIRNSRKRLATERHDGEPDDRHVGDGDYEEPRPHRDARP